MKIKQLLLILTIFIIQTTVVYAEDADSRTIYSEDVVQEQISENDWHFYRLDIETASKLTIKLRRISDDVDLYVAKTKKPDEDFFVCAPKKSGSSIETCRLSTNTAGVWYIGIHGKLDSDYQLGVLTKEINLVSFR